MGAWRVAGILGIALLLALMVRVRDEHSGRLEAARSAETQSEKGVLLAESARWTWPFGNERRERLEEALTIAEGLKTGDPEGARAVSEEVRATLYAVRVGTPGLSDVLSRANGMIVELLVLRDSLNAEEKETLLELYSAFDGPSPGAAAGSSAGFVLWLFGLWLSATEDRKRRVGGLAVAFVGLALFLGFLAVA